MTTAATAAAERGEPDPRKGGTEDERGGLLVGLAGRGVPGAGEVHRAFATTSHAARLASRCSALFVLSRHRNLPDLTLTLDRSDVECLICIVRSPCASTARPVQAARSPAGPGDRHRHQGGQHQAHESAEHVHADEMAELFT